MIIEQRLCIKPGNANDGSNRTKRFIRKPTKIAHMANEKTGFRFLFHMNKIPCYRCGQIKTAKATKKQSTLPNRDQRPRK